MIRDRDALDDLLRDVRAFVRDVAIPAEAQVERDDAVPEDIVAIMRAKGYFGWSIPEDHGGPG
ncbi:MAG: Acyl-CoA dehydrogenase, N-terminal domain [Rhodobacteraceae bacterium HLUCCA24]|nr:MAG: Acyl-CoA dehydrogenase, N-terminal domain [Rhodobacteraceae bacterium HLUCCA24]